MEQFPNSCLLWLGFLLLPLSHELNLDVSRARKLCGSHLLSAIVKLCGKTDWSQFQLEADTPMTELISQASQQVRTSQLHDDEDAPVSLPSDWERFTNPASVSASEMEAVRWEMQSLPKHHYEKDNQHSHKTRTFSSSSNVSPYIENLRFQKKNKNKIDMLSSLFWGIHPQRKRRGYSDKCCLKGCTKEELGIACLPYIYFES